VKKAERDSGHKPGLTSDMATRLKPLERENRELRQANEILRKASACFAGRSSTPTQAMIAFIDDHRGHMGIASPRSSRHFWASTFASSKATSWVRMPCRKDLRLTRTASPGT
jgi:hypothetical protein